MVYLAGDNNLEDYGKADLAEMNEVGSTEQVAIVAQFDSMEDGNSRRYYLQADTPLEDDALDAYLGETNTGDPRELVHFLVWAMNNYPAKRYALIMWNHGTGWKEEEVYRVAHGTVGAYRPASEKRARAIARRLSGRKVRPPLFSTTIKSVMARGISYDDSSADFLDNAEMKQALRCSLLASGSERLDLVGFDACLMSMLEIAYQVKDVADCIVGSQETEPAEGWPYAEILRGLTDDPTMDQSALGNVIIKAYMDSYGPEENISQSALDLSQIHQVVEALDNICSYVISNQEDCELILGRAVRRAQRFSDEDYKDLYDLCRLLAERSDHLPELKRRAEVVMDLLVPAGRGRFVCAKDKRGYRLENSHGVSIYFPEQRMSPFYKRLDFASESFWDDMLHRLFGI
jgi:hypothetical protein